MSPQVLDATAGNRSIWRTKAEATPEMEHRVARATAFCPLRSLLS